MADFWFLVPAHNEAEHIAHTLSLVQGAFRKKPRILVVDDGSADGTGRIAKENGAEVLALKKNLGKGGAVVIGMRALTKKNPAAVVMLDADLAKAPPQGMRLLAERAIRAAIANQRFQIFFTRFQSAAQGSTAACPRRCCR